MTMRVFGGPHRYVQGPGALAELAPLVALYGRRPFVIVDAAVMDLIRAKLEAVFVNSDVTLTFAAFSGECTAEKIDEMTAQGNVPDFLPHGPTPFCPRSRLARRPRRRPATIRHQTKPSAATGNRPSQ